MSKYLTINNLNRISKVQRSKKVPRLVKPFVAKIEYKSLEPPEEGSNAEGHKYEVFPKFDAKNFY